jgi:hypothetical protein
MCIQTKLIFFLSFCQVALFANNAGEVSTFYINSYKEIAISEMKRTGIPASIKLAQGLLESDWGRSELAVYGNNHFGIKCGSSYQGDGYYHEDDDYDSNGKLIESCFRKFDHPLSSYMAHSDFLMNNQRYDFLFEYDPTDYRSWAKGLRKAGYATDKKYPQKLIKIIEKYELYQYDTYTEQEEVYAGTDVDMMTRDAQKVDISLTKGKQETTFEEEEKVVAEVDKTRTRKTSREKTRTSSKQRKANKPSDEFYFVKDGDTMKDISRKYNIRLKSLYARNRMPLGSEPLVGEELRLSGLIRLDDRPNFVRFPDKKSRGSEFLF